MRGLPLREHQASSPLCLLFPGGEAQLGGSGRQGRAVVCVDLVSNRGLTERMRPPTNRRGISSVCTAAPLMREGIFLAASPRDLRRAPVHVTGPAVFHVADAPRFSPIDRHPLGQ